MSTEGFDELMESCSTILDGAAHKEAVTEHLVGLLIVPEGSLEIEMIDDGLSEQLQEDYWKWAHQVCHIIMDNMMTLIQMETLVHKLPEANPPESIRDAIADELAQAPDPIEMSIGDLLNALFGKKKPE